MNESKEAAERWLTRFGYLPVNRKGQATDDEAFKEALIRFKGIHGLPLTPELDERIWREMSRTRCGVPDPWGPGEEIRPDYTLSRCSWLAHRRFFTWRVLDSGKDIGMNDARAAIARAIGKWSMACDQLSFREATADESAVFTFRWASGAHGDKDPFDGPEVPGKRNIVAHAYYPPPCGKEFVGQCHFDDDEYWTIDIPAAADVEAVALHEIGHLLGLAHSANPQAVMWESVDEFSPRRDLHVDDIEGIRRLYGHRVLPGVTTVHIDGDGDVHANANELAGRPGWSRQVHNLRVKLEPPVPDLQVAYQALDAAGLWMNVGRDGSPSGWPPGSSFRIFGFGVYLNGPAAYKYSAQYMGHFSQVGNSSVFSDTQKCMAPGDARTELEGVLVRIVPR